MDTRPVGDPWTLLRGLTAARIGLAHTGAAIATGPMMAMREAHAAARDAVHERLDTVALAAQVAPLHPVAGVVDSAAGDRAGDRHDFLMRPDLGRRLAPEAAAILAPHAAEWDLAIVLADGLSARAVADHAAPLLQAALPALRAERWRIAPVVIVRQGRVAVGDRVAAALGAGAVAVLIGERPGLSSPNSLGVYITWKPMRDTTDAGRNCISNVHPGGVGYRGAAATLVGLLREMRRRDLSGVALKAEDMPPALPP